MKTKAVLFFIIVFCCNTFISTAQNSSVDMKFRYRDRKGENRVVNMPWIRFQFWAQSDNYPSYVKWVNQPFAVLKTGKHSASLFTDSISSFKPGSTISYAFLTRQNIGRFDMNYIKTNVCSFINNSEKPNTEIVESPKGLYFRAKKYIGPNTELTVDYSSLKNMFPNDPTVNKMVNK